MKNKLLLIGIAIIFLIGLVSAYDIQTTLCSNILACYYNSNASSECDCSQINLLDTTYYGLVSNKGLESRSGSLAEGVTNMSITAPFRFPQFIQIVNATLNINYFTSGTINNCKIQYSTDFGSTWVNLRDCSSDITPITYSYDLSNLTPQQLSNVYLNFTMRKDGGGAFSTLRLDYANLTIIYYEIPFNISIITPLPTSYLFVPPSRLNYTITRTPDYCQYSTNGGAVNNTITCGNNITGLSANEGNNTWDVYSRETLKYNTYQEFANSSYYTDAEQYVYVNYTKPSSSVNATWIHDWIALNYSLTQNKVFFSSSSNSRCWNGTNRLALRFSLSQGVDKLLGDCWNGTGFENVLSIPTGDWSASCVGISSFGSPDKTVDGIREGNNDGRIFFAQLSPDEWGVCTNSTGKANRGYLEEAITWGYEEVNYVSDSVTFQYNACQVLDAGNYSVSGGQLIGNPNSENLNSLVNVSADYTYISLSQGGQVMQDTSESFLTAVGFFPIIIVIGAMVVLIILAFMIINSIKGSGMVTA